MRIVQIVGVLLGTASLVVASQSAVAQASKSAKPSGDAVAGAKLFQQRCAVCHTKTGMGGPMAPDIRGVYGARAGGGTSPRTSAAMKASKLVWNETNLTNYLAGPRKLVPGSNMLIAVPNPVERKNIVAHVATLKK